MLKLTQDEKTWITLCENDKIRIRRRNHKGATKSWIWQHGILVSVDYKDAGKTEDRWFCCHCGSLHDNKSTGKPETHLKAHGKSKPNGPETAVTERTPIYVPDAEEYAECLVKLVAVNHRPFQFIESDEMKNFIRLMNPDAFDLLPKSADWLRTNAMRLFKQQKAQISKWLETLPYRPSLAFDAWSSPNGLAMLGIVAYWYDGDGSSTCVLLGMREIDGSHTGKNLAKIIEDIEREYTINPDDVVAHVSDNAANNGTTLDALGDPSRSTQVRCVGHSLNLSAKDALNLIDNRTGNDADETTTGPISKIRQLAIHVHRSTHLHQLWRKCFKNNIARDNKTRWNSVLTMLDSVLKQTSCLYLSRWIESVDIETPMKAKLQELALTQDEWNTLEDVQKILKPLQDCTMKLQGTVSLVVLADK